MLLDKVDSLIDTSPDSALVLIKGMDLTYNRSSVDKARYSLLLTFATLKTKGLSKVDKNVTDSLLNDAYRYYKKKSKPSRETMLFHFINALVQDSDEIRLQEYDKTIELATGRGEWDYKVLSWLHKSLIYYNAVSSEDELECIDSALFLINKVNRLDIRSYLAESAGRAYLGIEDFNKAEKYFLDFLRLAKEISDSTLIYKAQLNLGSVYRLQGRYQESVKAFDQVVHSDSYLPEFSQTELCSYAISLIETNRIEEAADLIELLSESKDSLDKLCYFMALAHMYLYKNNFRQVILLNDSINKYSNSLVIEKMQYRLPRKEKELEKRLHVLSNDNYESKIFIHKLWIMILLLAVCCIIVITAYCVLRNRLEINRLEKNLLESEKKDLYYAAQIKEIISQKELVEQLLEEKKKEMKEEIDKYRSAMQQAEDKFRKNKSELQEVMNDHRTALKVAQKSLLDNKIEMQEEINKQRIQMGITIENYENKIAQLVREKSENMLITVKTEAILCNKKIRSNDKVKKIEGQIIIEKYREKDIQQRIIKAINENSDNLLDYITSRCNLSDDGLLIIALDICRFDYIAIGLILEITTANASTKKTRVKQKLKEILNDDNRERLCHYIPMLK